MTADEAANDAPAGASKARDFADRVRLGEHLARVEKAGIELGVIKARLLDVVQDLDKQIQENALIAEAITRDRSGR